LGMQPSQLAETFCIFVQLSLADQSAQSRTEAWRSR